MNELIGAALNEGDVTPLVEFPRFLMNEFEKELVTWVLKYVKDYEKPPSVARLRREFPYFIPLIAEAPLPLYDIRDMTLKRKRVEYASMKMSEINAKMHDSGDVPIQELNKMMVDLSASDDELHKYSTFSRDMYFRGGRSLRIGFPIIDRAMGGFFAGDYFLVAGRLGTGKSTIQQFVAHKWWSEGRRILYISKEMLAVDVFSRIDGIVGKFNPLRIRTSSKEEMKSELKTVSLIASKGKGEIIIPSRQVNTPSQVGTLAQYLAIDAIVLDGVYLMQSDASHAAKWEMVATISNELKQVAMNMQVPLLASTQIKRVGGKTEYDPEDLAYSDALGQDADFIMTIHPTKADKKRMELQLIKNRFGNEVGSIVRIDHDTMSLIDESILGTTEAPRDEEDW